MDIKFSTVYPSYHPRKGEPTHFVEKIWTALDFKFETIAVESFPVICEAHRNFYLKDWAPKRTTIRSGHRWKKGDLFIPKIWTGKPYRSKPIAICDPLEILDVDTFSIRADGEYRLNDMPLLLSELKVIARDDGFDEVDDFELWFNWKKGQNFEGQRIRFA